MLQTTRACGFMLSDGRLLECSEAAVDGDFEALKNRPSCGYLICLVLEIRYNKYEPPQL